MPEIINIDLIDDQTQIFKLKLPEKVIVNRGTHVIWKLKVQHHPFFIGSVRFTIYFSDLSPFIWHRDSTVVLAPYPLEWFVPGRDVTLAEGTADVPGDYKYGAKASDAESD